jgi:hypothetical protein
MRMIEGTESLTRSVELKGVENFEKQNNIDLLDIMNEMKII